MFFKYCYFKSLVGYFFCYVSANWSAADYCYVVFLHYFLVYVTKIYNRIVDTVAVEGATFTSVLFIILVLESIGGMFFFSRRKQKKKDECDDEESERNGLLCRFVLDGVGRKVGESVAVDDDILIIKSGSKYLGVPLKHIEEEEKTLLVKGLVDQDKAEEMGENWRQASFYETDNEREGN